jgi:hypothetical protein
MGEEANWVIVQANNLVYPAQDGQSSLLSSFWVYSRMQRQMPIPRVSIPET